MINLEELNLFLSVVRFDSTYLDGIQSYDTIKQIYIWYQDRSPQQQR